MKTTTQIKSLLFSLLCPALVLAQQPQLLKDIATQGFFLSSSPQAFMRAGDNIYFTAAENGLYQNIWISDGTAAGTAEATIDEYSGAFVIPTIIPFGNNLIVTGSSISPYVYFVDGTPTGEVQIMDDHAYDFTYGIGASNSFVINNEVFFWAKRSNEAVGAELYKSDGTAAGTSLFKDFNPGSGKGYGGATASSHCIQATPNKAYVLASNGDSLGIYETDGSSVTLLMNLLSDQIGADINFYGSIVNGHVFFKTLYKIWSLKISDNSISEFSLPGNGFFVGVYHMNNNLFAISHGSLATRDLHKSDGTSFETIADDFVSSAGSIYPWTYSTKNCEANGKFYFTAHQSGSQSVELWVTDGTETGTIKVLDSIGVSGQGMDNIYTCGDRTFYYQAGAVQTLFEINPTTHALDIIVDSVNAAPFMDEENCRFYMSYSDPVALVEPHYIDFGAPTSNTISAPSNLMASAKGRASGKVELTWQDNSNNEDGFYVERGTDGSSFAQIASLGMDETSYLDTTSLAGSTQYFYQVKAYNANGVSAASNVAETTTYPLSVSKLSENEFDVYPNPTSGILNISINANGTYQLVDLRGVIISNGKLQAGMNQIEENTATAGIYFLVIETDLGNETQKVVFE